MQLRKGFSEGFLKMEWLMSLRAWRQTHQRIRKSTLSYMRHVLRGTEQNSFYWFLMKSQNVVISRIYFKKIETELTTRNVTNYGSLTQ